MDAVLQEAALIPSWRKSPGNLWRWVQEECQEVPREFKETAELDVEVLNLTILLPDRPDLVMSIPLFIPDEKGYSFALMGDSPCPYRFHFNFVVSMTAIMHECYLNSEFYVRKYPHLSLLSKQSQIPTVEGDWVVGGDLPWVDLP